MEGTCLLALVRMAIPLCRAAEQECPRTGPGRPPDYADWKIAVLIMIAVFKKRKSKSAQYRYLHEHRRTLIELLELPGFPARSTYFDRYRRVHRLFEVAIRLQGQKGLRDGLADARTVAVDQSLVEARGPRWHAKERRANRVPRRRGVDRDSAWGYCAHRQWVHGYSYEVVVTASKGSVVFPLLASVHAANVRESTSFGPKIDFLPHSTRYVVADAGYDDVRYADRIEYDDDGRRTGRRFVCAPQNRPRTDRQPKWPTKARQAARQLRLRRLEFYDSATGQRLAARRSQTVEPFNEWFKSLFEFDHRVWHRGIENNQTQMLAAIFGYQLLIRYNRRRGHQNGRIKWILDTL